MNLEDLTWKFHCMKYGHGGATVLYSDEDLLNVLESREKYFKNGDDWRYYIKKKHLQHIVDIGCIPYSKKGEYYKLKSVIEKTKTKPNLPNTIVQEGYSAIIDKGGDYLPSFESFYQGDTLAHHLKNFESITGIKVSQDTAQKSYIKLINSMCFSVRDLMELKSISEAKPELSDDIIAKGCYIAECRSNTYDPYTMNRLTTFLEFAEVNLSENLTQKIYEFCIKINKLDNLKTFIELTKIALSEDVYKTLRSHLSINDIGSNVNNKFSFRESFNNSWW